MHDRKIKIIENYYAPSTLFKRSNSPTNPPSSSGPPSSDPFSSDSSSFEIMNFAVVPIPSDLYNPPNENGKPIKEDKIIYHPEKFTQITAKLKQLNTQLADYNQQYKEIHAQYNAFCNEIHLYRGLYLALACENPKKLAEDIQPDCPDLDIDVLTSALIVQWASDYISVQQYLADKISQTLEYIDKLEKNYKKQTNSTMSLLELARQPDPTLGKFFTKNKIYDLKSYAQIQLTLRAAQKEIDHILPILDHLNSQTDNAPLSKRSKAIYNHLKQQLINYEGEIHEMKQKIANTQLKLELHTPPIV